MIDLVIKDLVERLRCWQNILTKEMHLTDTFRLFSEDGICALRTIKEAGMREKDRFQ